MQRGRCRRAGRKNELGNVSSELRLEYSHLESLFASPRQATRRRPSPLNPYNRTKETAKPNRLSVNASLYFLEKWQKRVGVERFNILKIRKLLNNQQPILIKTLTSATRNTVFSTVGERRTKNARRLRFHSKPTIAGTKGKRTVKRLKTEVLRLRHTGCLPNLPQRSIYAVAQITYSQPSKYRSWLAISGTLAAHNPGHTWLPDCPSFAHKIRVDRHPRCTGITA
jgi:hypothetical protein